MRIVISGIPIDVQKKNIKNMHLQVKPPDGHVVISAPLSVDDKAIEAYARTQLGFIKRAIAQFQEQPRASRRQYVSGETMYIWGKQYFLVFFGQSEEQLRDSEPEYCPFHECKKHGKATGCLCQRGISKDSKRRNRKAPAQVGSTDRP